MHFHCLQVNLHCGGAFAHNSCGMNRRPATIKSQAWPRCLMHGRRAPHSLRFPESLRAFGNRRKPLHWAKLAATSPGAPNVKLLPSRARFTKEALVLQAGCHGRQRVFFGTCARHSNTAISLP